MTQFIDNPIRRRYIQKPEEIADRLELEPGMTVLEIGPGKGSYTIEVARRVHPGTVYAFDISPTVVGKLGERARIYGTYLAVNVVYATIFDENPEGLTYVPKGID